MADVIEMNKHREVWSVSLFFCGACGHEWSAVWAAYAHDAKSWGHECEACSKRTGFEVQRLNADGDVCMQWGHDP